MCVCLALLLHELGLLSLGAAEFLYSALSPSPHIQQLPWLLGICVSLALSALTLLYRE